MRRLSLLFAMLLYVTPNDVTGVDDDQCPLDDFDGRSGNVSCTCKCRCMPIFKYYKQLPAPEERKLVYCPPPFFAFIGLCMKFYTGGEVNGNKVCDTCREKMDGAYGLSFHFRMQVAWMSKGFVMVHPEIKEIWTSAKRTARVWKWEGTGVTFLASDYDWTNDPFSGDCAMVDLSARKLRAVDCGEMGHVVCQKDFDIHWS